MGTVAGGDPVAVGGVMRGRWTVQVAWVIAAVLACVFVTVAVVDAGTRRSWRPIPTTTS